MVTLLFNSALLGIGLAMDAFSVSLANGLNEPCMRKRKMFGIAGIFAFFQGLMPLIGWVCIHTIVQYFKFFEKLIPWIALVILGFIGIKMIYEGITEAGDCPCEQKGIGFSALVIQGIATSIDALSVGFTIEEYNFPEALLSSSIISVLTFGICLVGIVIGRKAGTYLSGKAGIFGGAILVFIGLEIFVTKVILG